MPVLRGPYPTECDGDGGGIPAAAIYDDLLIGPYSVQAIGDLIACASTNLANSSTYPAASRTLAYPFEIEDDYPVLKMWWANGTVAQTDLCDVGVFSEDGQTLHVSTGPQAIAGTTTLQEVDVADVVLPRGRYWMAYKQNGVTAKPFHIPFNTTQKGVGRCTGAAQMDGSGSTLTAPFVPSAMTSGTSESFIVWCGISKRLRVQ